MKMNKILCLLLVLILVLSLGQSAFASGNATVLIEPVKEVKLLTVKEAADQLKLIASNFKQLKQDDSSFEWKYAVTDLDHDGQLELVAAAMHPEDRSTNFKVFELSEKLDHFVSCNVKLEEGESFPTSCPTTRTPIITPKKIPGPICSLTRSSSPRTRSIPPSAP